jgi:hypothetical protein
MHKHQDRETAARLRTAIRLLLKRGQLRNGTQTQLADLYGVSRQRINRIVSEERRMMNGSSPTSADTAPTK